MDHVLTFEQMGLPGLSPDVSINRLVFNEPAEALVLVLQPRRLVNPGDLRVFLRAAASPSYTEVIPPLGRPSISSIVVASSTARAFIEVLEWRTDGRTGSDHAGIFAVDLSSASLRLLPEPSIPGHLNWPTSPTSTWPSQLIASSPDGSAIYGVFAFSVPEDSRSRRVDYWLSRYDVTDGITHPLHPLPGIVA